MRNLLLLLSIVMMSACQKDFYLEDLNDALGRIDVLETQNRNLEGRISTLQGEATQLQSQLSALGAENAELEAEINSLNNLIAQVQNDYNNAVISLAEANARIDELEDELEELTIALSAKRLVDHWGGRFNRKFRVVSEETWFVEGDYRSHIRSGQEIPYNVRTGFIPQDAWLELNVNTRNLVNPNGAPLTEFLGIISVERYLYLGYWALGSSIQGLDRVVWRQAGDYQDRHVPDQFHGGLTSRLIERGGKLKIISENELEVAWESVAHSDIEGGVITIETTVRLELDEGPSEGYVRNGEPITRTEMHNIYREGGQGIYADPVYRNINFDEPRTLLVAFVEDAARNGLDISYALNEQFNNNIVNYGYGYAYGTPCQTGTINVSWEDSYDDKMAHDLDRGFGDLKVFWHEFGHAILNLQHNCVEQDIMHADSEGRFPCVGPVVTGQYADERTVEGFTQSAARMFQNIGQQPYDCGFGTRKAVTHRTFGCQSGHNHLTKKQ